MKRKNKIIKNIVASSVIVATITSGAAICTHNYAVAEGSGSVKAAARAVRKEKSITPDYVYTTDRVNIREYATTDSNVILTVDPNTELKRVGINVADGWDMVVVGAANYCICNKYITTIKPDKKAKSLAQQFEDNKIPEEDLRYMSAIIHAEAGNQCEAGKQAVGIVVMNRKESNIYADTIYNVINEPGQFTPVTNGSFVEALTLYDSGQLSEETIKAAKFALRGHKTVIYNDTDINLDGFLYFSRWVDNAKVVIQDHMFR